MIDRLIDWSIDRLMNGSADDTLIGRLMDWDGLMNWWIDEFRREDEEDEKGIRPTMRISTCRIWLEKIKSRKHIRTRSRLAKYLVMKLFVFWQNILAYISTNVGKLSIFNSAFIEVSTKRPSTDGQLLNTSIPDSPEVKVTHFITKQGALQN